MRKSLTVLGLSTLFVLGTASLSLAAEAKTAEGKMAAHHSEAHKMVGEVVSVDATAHTLVVKEMLKKGNEMKQMTFEWTDKTKVMMSDKGAMASFADIKSGDSVTVHYHGMAGKMMATEVVVAKAMKK